ncbi:MAG: hypothetical protein ACE5FR_09505 [Rhodospirillales bacterium]
MYRKTLQTSVAAAALFAFAAPFAGPASAGGNTVVNGKSQVKLAITGQLSRVVSIVDDGNTTNIHHTSNQFSGNRVRFIGTAKAWDSLTIGTRIEFQFNNRTSSASGNSTADTIDEDEGDGSGIDPRYQDITFAGKWGKLYMGKGDSAANGTSEVDLSGTIIASNPSVADMGFGGSVFIVENVAAGASQDPNINAAAAGPKASSVFNGFDGLSRTQRLRYDTPTFGGFKISAGLNQGPIGDAAIRFKGSFAGTKVSAALGWFNRDSASATIGNQFNGSGSILHSSGLSVTVAGATRELEATGRTDPSMLYVKLGYKAKLVDAGTTNFYVNWQNTEDLASNGDDATAWGFGVVQILKDYATELFAAFSVADFDDSSTSTYEDLTTGLIGARLKF